MEKLSWHTISRTEGCTPQSFRRGEGHRPWIQAISDIDFWIPWSSEKKTPVVPAALDAAFGPDILLTMPKYQKVHPFFWKHMNSFNSQRITSQRKKICSCTSWRFSARCISLSCFCSCISWSRPDSSCRTYPVWTTFVVHHFSFDNQKPQWHIYIYIYLAWKAEKVRDQRKQRGRRGDQFDKNLGFCLQYFEREDFEVLNKLIWHCKYIDPALAWIKASVSEHRRSTSLFSKRMACNLVFSTNSFTCLINDFLMLPNSQSTSFNIICETL